MEALEYLKREGVHDAKRPDIVLLDLDLPGRHGRDSFLGAAGRA